jgi:hypothetical protein
MKRKHDQPGYMGASMVFASVTVIAIALFITAKATKNPSSNEDTRTYAARTTITPIGHKGASVTVNVHNSDPAYTISVESQLFGSSTVVECTSGAAAATVTGICDFAIDGIYLIRAKASILGTVVASAGDVSVTSPYDGSGVVLDLTIPPPPSTRSTITPIGHKGAPVTVNVHNSNPSYTIKVLAQYPGSTSTFECFRFASAPILKGLCDFPADGAYLVSAKGYTEAGVEIISTGNLTVVSPYNGTGVVMDLTIPLPTNTPTKVPTKTPAICPKKTIGDANCDDSVDYVDYEVYRRMVLRKTVPSGYDANFNPQQNNTIGTDDLDILLHTLGGQLR